MVSVLASSAVDRGFEPRSGHTKDDKIGICCFKPRTIVRVEGTTNLLFPNTQSISILLY
jgi:hypothetical protein